MSLELLKSAFWGLTAVAGVASAGKALVGDRLNVASSEAWSMYNLAKVGHAALVYAADNDDVLPFAAGNYAYAKAVRSGQGCESIGPEFAEGCKPVNALLQGYGTNWTTFVSQNDRCVIDGRETSWHEYTTTEYPGASFEYFWHPSYSAKPLSEFGDSKSQPLFISMFDIKTEGGSKNQVVYLDGHIGMDTRDHLASIPPPGIN